MADTPSKKPKESESTAKNPDPEVLKPRERDMSDEAEADASSGSDGKKKSQKTSKHGKLSLRSRYHLSHKATFIGLTVVAVILAVNAAIVLLVIDDTPDEDEDLSGQVTVSEEALEGLGVNRTATEDVGVELTIGPNTNFEREVQIAGDLSVGGEMVLNQRLSAVEVSMDTLQAADATLEQLNVNGDGTMTNMNVREDMAVAGSTRLQGPVTVSELLTVENDVNVANDLTVGGTLSVNTFRASNLAVDGNVTLGNHVITRGAAPSVTVGPAAGSNGTVSISGNDTAGTVAFNAGTDAGGGVVANVNFANNYNNIPHVVITPVGDVGSFYISRSQEGFSISVSNQVSPGGYAFDYIVVQ